LDKAFVILLLALLIDRIFGDPHWLWGYIPHPIVFFGQMISWFDTFSNRSDFSLKRRYLYGWLVIAALLGSAVGIGWLLTKIYCSCWPIVNLFLEAVTVSFFLTQKSLTDHVMTVCKALEEGGIEQGRSAVSMIVGRDTQMLDASGVCRAAIESLAENSSDGIIAPIFWYVISGLPGLLGYKMLNTADSMIGHKNERYAAFGFASARLDDIANYIPARLTGILIVLVSLFTNGNDAAKRAWRVMLYDAGHHHSPNSGWPESAFAGALNIRLSGPRYYGTKRLDEPFQNIEGKEPETFDIRRAVRLFESVMNNIAIFTLILYILYVSF